MMKPSLIDVAIVLCISKIFINGEEEPCKDGICPTPMMENISSEENECGLWMGPSPIKEHENHGFGLGMFTGKAIKNKEVVSSDIFIPIFDWEGALTHPPLLEYLWRGGAVTKGFDYMKRTVGYYFIPGVGTIVPCTSSNYNLEIIDSIQETPDKFDKPNSGSYSIYTSVMYRAVRDISPGEELTAECTDADFDGGSYSLHRYTPKEDGIMCLDDNLVVSNSTLSDAGKGVFSKQKLKMGQTILSSPLIPIHRQDMQIPKNLVNEYNIPEEQLLINYCFGHPNSDLLWLPFGLIANYINHHSTPNVKIQWHEPPSHVSPTNRQSYHHPELFDLLPGDVAKVHGKGLVLDYVALRDIEPNEEIFIDYGPEWKRAWEKHFYQWKPTRVDYMTANEYLNTHDTTVLRTAREQYDHPYPSNIQFLCQISNDWDDPPRDAGRIEHVFTQDKDHSCLTPCTIQDRYELRGIVEDNMFYFNDEVADDDPRLHKMAFYRVTLLDQDDNDDMDYECKIVPEVEYTYHHVPRSAIGIADKPYSTTMSQPNAFRHPLGTGDLYPDTWLERKVRRKKPTLTAEDISIEAFKRKKPEEPVKKKGYIDVDVIRSSYSITD